MITLFSGEFLYHPVPLEMSMNACSHGCVYCFANLRNGERAFDSKKFASQMNKLMDSDTFTSKKIKQGYGVTISNNTDPFAKNNARITEGILPTLIAKKIPLFFQTKGGDRLQELCSDIPRSDFYFSMTMLNEDIREIVEPMAPSIEKRFEYINWLIGKGHNVSVGINPLVKEWMPENDLDIMMNKCKEVGIKSFVIQSMHFGKRNKEKLLKRDFGGADIDNYIGKNRETQLYFQKALLKYNKFGTIAFNQPFYSKGIEYNASAQGKRYLTAQHFINNIYEKYGENEHIITFNEYLNFFNDGFIDEYSKQRYDEYILLTYFDAWKGKPKNQNIHSKEHLYNVIWNEEAVRINLRNNILFEDIGKDIDGNVLMKWNGGRIKINGEYKKLLQE